MPAFTCNSLRVGTESLLIVLLELLQCCQRQIKRTRSQETYLGGNDRDFIIQFLAKLIDSQPSFTVQQRMSMKLKQKEPSANSSSQSKMATNQ